MIYDISFSGTNGLHQRGNRVIDSLTEERAAYRQRSSIKAKILIYIGNMILRLDQFKELPAPRIRQLECLVNDLLRTAEVLVAAEIRGLQSCLNLLDAAEHAVFDGCSAGVAVEKKTEVAAWLSMVEKFANEAFARALDETELVKIRKRIESLLEDESFGRSRPLRMLEQGLEQPLEQPLAPGF